MQKEATYKELDYAPFGMQIPARSFTGTSGYKFGYQGSEKDFDVNQGAYTTHFRMLDTRLGRWWSIDPVFQPWQSSYTSMDNNPIWFNDPKGDIFKIGNKDVQAKKDVQSLAKNKNKDYIKFNDKNGDVTVDFGDIEQKKVDKILKKDKGLNLIKELSTAKNEDGNDLNFFYGTDGPINARDRETKTTLDVPFPSHIPGTETTKPDFFMNLSITPYSKDMPYLLPKKGFDGQVAIAKGSAYIWTEKIVYNAEKGESSTQLNLTKVPRSRIVYHELKENLLRTRDKMSYFKAHSKAGGIGKVEKFKFE